MRWSAKEITTVLERPSTQKLPTLSENDLKEYTELVNKSKIYSPYLMAESFKCFLNHHDIPVFNLIEVVKYMDEQVKKSKEAKDKGWIWKPLREKDKIKNGAIGSVDGIRSDFYRDTGGWPIYDKEIPLHALKKVALIEEHFQDRIKLFVSDYASHVPDPFLMAVIVNSNEMLNKGKCRYIIDMWDEPGFGLERQLVPSA